MGHTFIVCSKTFIYDQRDSHQACSAVNVMFDNKTLEKLVAHMNKHVPSRRRRLSELLPEKDPVYVGRDGTIYHVSRNELEIFVSYTNELERNALMIPILIMTDTSYPGGASKVMGRI